MTQSANDYFIPSEALAQQIGEAQLRSARAKRRWPWTFTNRLDVTRTEAPDSANEPLSISRAREAIKVRFLRLVVAIARRARAVSTERVPIVTPVCLVKKFGKALARDFGFDDTSAQAAWSGAFAEELRTWLSAFPNRRKSFRFGALAVENDGSIVLFPNEQKPR